MATLAELSRRASPQAVELARTILEQDLADRAWGEQVGPALSQRDVARLLGKSEQAVSKDRRLLRVRNRDGRPVYPVFQFHGRAHKPGVAEVVAALAGVVEPLTVASWLTARNSQLDGHRPIDVIDGGQPERAVQLARRLARSAG